jgi:hypothetical protein
MIKIDETLTNFIKEIYTQQRRNKRNKKKDPNYNKRTSPKVDHDGAQNKSCSKTPTNYKKHIRKKWDEKIKK